MYCMGSSKAAYVFEEVAVIAVASCECCFLSHQLLSPGRIFTRLPSESVWRIHNQGDGVESVCFSDLAY